ncbi:MAG: hypothetical protein ACR2MN_01390, partial [Acidimicrobiales bacterium]
SLVTHPAFRGFPPGGQCWSTPPPATSTTATSNCPPKSETPASYRAALTHLHTIGTGGHDPTLPKPVPAPRAAPLLRGAS